MKWESTSYKQSVKKGTDSIPNIMGNLNHSESIGVTPKQVMTMNENTLTQIKEKLENEGSIERRQTIPDESTPEKTTLNQQQM